MNEGDLVTVVGKVDSRIKDLAPEARVGTFWANVSEKRVLVLLNTGDIYLGHTYDIVQGAVI